MRINLGEEEQPEIGLIALIDCIFFLLMFFMVATSFKQTTEHKKQQELPILLPAATNSLDYVAADQPLVISVDSQGRTYINSEKVSLEQLHAALQSAAQKNPTQPIRIDGDQNTRYNNIVHILDLCQLNGLNNISLRTRK